MFYHCDFFLDTDDEYEEEETYISRRIIRDKADPMSIPNLAFKNLFRLSKEAFIYVLERIDSKLPSSKSTYIPNILKLCATLRFLAEGGYQRGIGQDFLVGMAQPTLSTTLSKVLSVMEDTFCAENISYVMTEHEMAASKQYFYNKYRFPGIIGCVDGTHINIIRPSTNEHLYFNRKGHHSVNAMIVCDNKMMIRAIDARFGGASHDSFVFSLSEYRGYLHQRWNNGDKRSWLLGDSGYTLEPWMMTPYRSAEEGSRKEQFNTVHSKARNVVERTIGVLKSRFRCLLGARQLHYSPEKAIQIANVCAALHNICIKYGVPEIPIATHDDDDDDQGCDLVTNNQLSSVAATVRNQIKDNL